MKHVIEISLAFLPYPLAKPNRVMTCENKNLRSSEVTVKAGMIGAGAFAMTLLAQSRQIPGLEIAVLCDRRPEIVHRACQRVGWPEVRLTFCRHPEAVATAIDDQRLAIVADPSLVLSASIDVLVESTGDPEAGAAHALGAIRAGRHVVMVNKETDVVVGPLLNRLAEKAGCVYTPVDGDQHGLLIDFVQWARSLGLAVVCAGKARNAEGIISGDGRQIRFGDQIIVISAADEKIWRPVGAGVGRSVCGRRMQYLDGSQRAEEPDLCEMTIVANATGLKPDVPALHSPMVRIAEIPEILSARTHGGLLETAGCVEVITCLRDETAHGMGGGIFITVACNDDPPWDLIKSKGFGVNHLGSCAVLIRPYHLLGIETPRTIFEAVRRQRSILDPDYRPRYDLTAVAVRDLAAGDRLTGPNATGAHQLDARITPAQPVRDRFPVPFHMAMGRQLRVDVAAGEILNADMLTPPENGVLWPLRKQQDDLFLTDA